MLEGGPPTRPKPGGRGALEPVLVPEVTARRLTSLSDVVGGRTPTFAVVSTVPIVSAVQTAGREAAVRRHVVPGQTVEAKDDRRCGTEQGRVAR
jgi:hypothetical protein